MWTKVSDTIGEPQWPVMEVLEEICPFSDPAQPHPRKLNCEDGYIIDEGGFRGFCSCFLAYKQRRNTENYLDQFGTELRLEIMRADYDRGALKLVLENWWPSQAKLPKTRAMILSGEPGTGKTIAAHASAVRLMQKTTKRVLFLSARNIGKWLGNLTSTDPLISQQARESLEMIYESIDPERWIFVIDDLGRERETGAVPQNMADILAAIYEKRMILILSTNLTSKQVGERYGSEIRSRLLDLAWITPIRCTGDDLRIKKNLD